MTAYQTATTEPMIAIAHDVRPRRAHAHDVYPSVGAQLDRWEVAVAVEWGVGVTSGVAPAALLRRAAYCCRGAVALVA